MVSWWVKVLIYAAVGIGTVAGGGYGGSYGGMYAPAARYGYTMAPATAPASEPAPAKLFGPCARHGSTIVNSWRNGDEPVMNYEYQVNVVNDCDHTIYDMMVEVGPVEAITQEWNADLDKSTGTFHFPEWARTWGLAAQSALTFGFISSGRVEVKP